MKRRRDTKDVHVTQPCDEWLSTRNKHKIKPPSPKPKRRKSGVYRGFPRQSSSSLWHLTQSAPPHPLLFTATKQSTIQGFFKPTKSTDNIGDESPTNSNNEHKIGIIQNQSSDEDGYSDNETSPVNSSEERPVTAKKTKELSSKRDISTTTPDKTVKTREVTLNTLNETPHSMHGNAIEGLSTGIDFPELSAGSLLSQDSVFTTEKDVKQSSHLSIFRDFESDKSFDIKDNSISFKKKKKPATSLSLCVTESHDVSADSLVFTQDDLWDMQLLEDAKKRKSERSFNSPGWKILIKASRRESTYADDSLTFTETQTDDKQSDEARPRWLQELLDDQSSDSFPEHCRSKLSSSWSRLDRDQVMTTGKKISNNGVAVDDKMIKTDLSDLTQTTHQLYDVNKERLCNNGQELQAGITSLPPDEEKQSRKTLAVTQGKEDDPGNLIPCNVKCWRHRSLQNQSAAEQADQYQKSTEHPALGLKMAADVNLLDLSTPEISPGGMQATRSAKCQRPCWIARLADNGKKFCGKGEKHVFESLKFDNQGDTKDISDCESDNELLLSDYPRVGKIFCQSRKVAVQEQNCTTDINNSLTFTPTQH